MKIEIITPLYTFLSVCFYSEDVKTAEPIGAKFCVGPHIIPGKVYGCFELKKILFLKIHEKK